MWLESGLWTVLAAAAVGVVYRRPALL